MERFCSACLLPLLQVYNEAPTDPSSWDQISLLIGSNALRTSKYYVGIKTLFWRDSGSSALLEINEKSADGQLFPTTRIRTTTKPIR